MPQRSGIKLAEWKFQKHKAQSKFRGIDFNFTFEEWINWWLSYGVDKTLDIKWPPKTRPCMSRYNDTGPYEISNVYFSTHDQNLKDHHKFGNVGTANPKGRRTLMKYRWGTKLITLETLQTKYKILTQYDWKFYKESTYDSNRKKECKTLTKQWNKIPSVLWWETDLGCYKTLDDASKFEGVAVHILEYRFVNATKQYKHKVNPYSHYKKIKVKISLEDYIRKNSRFPDPLFTL
jgi:hypothetical protein